MDLYRHFKDRGRAANDWTGVYAKVMVAEDEATGQTVVVYMSVTDGRVWVRPEVDFNATVERDDFNYAGPRFIPMGVTPAMRAVLDLLGGLTGDVARVVRNIPRDTHLLFGALKALNHRLHRYLTTEPLPHR